MRAGIYPAMIVATNNMTARMNVPKYEATKIPSLNGKFMGCAMNKGFNTAKTKTEPIIMPQSA